MKVENTGTKSITQGSIESIKYSISEENNIFIMSMLATTLYSDRILAPIREIITNAFDAHLMNGCDKLVEITAPDGFTSTFSVRDFGPGIHPDKMNDFFSFGESNKRGSNIATGGFGIGSKSPYAIADTFAVTIIYDGCKYIWQSYKDKDQPLSSCLHSHPTDEPNGVLFEIPIKKEDINEFRSKLTTFLSFVRSPFLLKNLPETPIYSITSTDFESKKSRFEIYPNRALTQRNANQIKVRMGDILYNIPSHWYVPYSDVNHLPLSYQERNSANTLPCFKKEGVSPHNHSNSFQSYLFLKSLDLAKTKGVFTPLSRTNHPIILVIDMPIGELPISPSREQIIDTPTSKAKLIALYNEFESEVLLKHIENSIAPIVCSSAENYILNCIVSAQTMAVADRILRKTLAYNKMDKKDYPFFDRPALEWKTPKAVVEQLKLDKILNIPDLKTIGHYDCYSRIRSSPDGKFLGGQTVPDISLIQNTYPEFQFVFAPEKLSMAFYNNRVARYAKNFSGKKEVSPGTFRFLTQKKLEDMPNSLYTILYDYLVVSTAPRLLQPSQPNATTAAVATAIAPAITPVKKARPYCYLAMNMGPALIEIADKATLDSRLLDCKHLVPVAINYDRATNPAHHATVTTLGFTSNKILCVYVQNKEYDLFLKTYPDFLTVKQLKEADQFTILYQNSFNTIKHGRYYGSLSAFTQTFPTFAPALRPDSVKVDETKKLYDSIKIDPYYLAKLYLKYDFFSFSYATDKDFPKKFKNAIAHELEILAKHFAICMNPHAKFTIDTALEIPLSEYEIDHFSKYYQFANPTLVEGFPKLEYSLTFDYVRDQLNNILPYIGNSDKLSYISCFHGKIMVDCVIAEFYNFDISETNPLPQDMRLRYQEEVANKFLAYVRGTLVTTN